MTRTGDHGGDSQDELRAALFVYSPTPLSGSVSVIIRVYLIISVAFYCIPC